MISTLLNAELLELSKSTTIVYEDIRQYLLILDNLVWDHIKENICLNEENFFRSSRNQQKLKEYARFLVFVFEICKTLDIKDLGDIKYIYELQYQMHTNENIDFLTKKFYL